MSVKENMEIRNEIQRLNQQLKEVINTSQYILNNVVVDITNQIKELQDKCPHDEIDETGFCVFCNKLVRSKEEED